MSAFRLAPLTKAALVGALAASGNIASAGLGPIRDLIASAKAAGHMWVRLDNGVQTFSAAWPAPIYRDAAANYPALIYAWGCIAADDEGLDLWGGGHANSSANEPFRFSFITRGWSLSFYGSVHINVQPGPNTHRVAGFNDAPVSSHSYCNNVKLKVSGRLLTFGGAAWNDGSVLRVFDPNIPGNQPGLRFAGAFSLDMSLAGQGYAAGSAGTNPGPTLPAANAWRLHDWFRSDHPTRPVFGGTSYHVHGDRGAVAVEEGGQDVVYYTAGTGLSLLRAVIHPTDHMQDVVSRLFNDTSFGAEDPVAGGNLAFDPVDRVFVSLAAGAGPYEPFRFVDLKRDPVGGWRRPTAPAGQAALKAESKGEPGLEWDPIDGCYVGFCRGSFGLPGAFATGGVWRLYKPAPSGGLTPDAGWSISRRDPAGGTPIPPMQQWPGESFVQVCGRVRRVPSLGIIAYVTNPSVGEVWGYIPESWDRSMFP